MAHHAFEQPIRAVLMDVDGTLYNQRLLRAFMALELCVLPLSRRSLRSASATWRAIRRFRRVREQLRHVDGPSRRLATLQYTETAQHLGEASGTIESIVSEWLYQRPLKYLPLCRRRALETFLSFLEGKGLPVGVFSDYPVVDKLRALGLLDKVSLRLCATDAEINAFKPHPEGFLRACAIWGLPPAEVLYVGDRPEVDAVGASAAGMPCAIVSRRVRRVRHGEVSGHSRLFASFAELQRALARHS